MTNLLLDTLSWARRYGRAQYSVIPLRPHDKKPWSDLLPVKKDAAGNVCLNENGTVIHSWERFQRERPNDAVVEQWFTDCPNANLGICTGIVSGLFVLDCDNMRAIDDVYRRGVSLKTPIVLTGKGAHMYFRMPDFAVGNRAGLLDSVDIRGTGGYVVAPPSIHPSGAIYHWQDKPLYPCDAPPWLLDMLRPPDQRERTGTRPPPPNLNLRGAAYGRAALTAEHARLCTATVGQRNAQLNRSAFNLGQLIADGLLDRGEVERVLLADALYLDLGERESLATIASGSNAGLKKPRANRKQTTI
jgi:hypothetical protein